MATSDETFQRALAFTLRRDIEGGWYDGSGAHDPNPTNLGVTLRTLVDARLDLDGDGDSDLDDLRALTPAAAAPLYRDRYWRAAGCHELNELVAIAHFDMAVNAGPRAAIRALQRALHLHADDVDGVFGPFTRNHAQQAMPLPLINGMLWARLEHYELCVVRDARKAPALRHWLYRVLQLRKYLSVPI